jgi:Flp pilus assembly protein TadG
MTIASRRSGPTPTTHAGKIQWRRFRLQFQSCRDGSAAIEFGLLALPFITLLVAILETALVFFAQQVLQTASSQSARLIMTGQAQTQGMTGAQFQQAVCANASNMFDCTGLYVNVQTFASFGSIVSTPPLQNGQFNTASMVFKPGNPGDIEVVQVYYNWPVITGLPGLTLANNGNNRLLVGTAVFRNEPY